MYQEPGGNRTRSRSGTLTPVALRSKSPMTMMADDNDDEDDELFVITQVAHMTPYPTSPSNPYHGYPALTIIPPCAAICLSVFGCPRVLSTPCMRGQWAMTTILASPSHCCPGKGVARAPAEPLPR